MKDKILKPDGGTWRVTQEMIDDDIYRDKPKSKIRKTKPRLLICRPNQVKDALRILDE